MTFDIGLVNQQCVWIGSVVMFTSDTVVHLECNIYTNISLVLSPVFMYSKVLNGIYLKNEIELFVYRLVLIIFIMNSVMSDLWTIVQAQFTLQLFVFSVC